MPADPAEAPEPDLGFDDSRRLTGASRCFGGTAVTLTATGAAARDPAAHAGWAERVRALCAALGWPAPSPRVQLGADAVTLQFAAPQDLLFTGTEINEWAWQRAAAVTGETGFAFAADTAGVPDDAADAAAFFAGRAAAEFKPAWAALRTAAQARGLLVLADDETASIGAGAGSRSWPLDALPQPLDVPWPALHGVPTVLVTGSNGKTTTVRLVAAIAAHAGLTAGWCCTEGVFIAGRALASGDWSGPAGARAVLRHPGVQAAVLETARGGILRRGLAVASADAAVVTNVSPDHLGEYGIGTAADLAEVKLALAHALGACGTLVLNADDAGLMAAALRLPHAAAARQALFAHDAAHPALAALRERGGSTCGAAGGQLVLDRDGVRHDLGAVAGMPVTLGGAARHNVENACAAALAAASLGWPAPAIAAALASFGLDPQDNPGRLERWPHGGATVLIDYAHNPDGLAQLLAVARALRPRRLGLLLGQAGNRDDAAIAELARTAARFEPDRIVVKELPGMLRGRAAGVVTALLADALAGAGLAAPRVALQSDEEAAARALLAWAQPGDVVVLPIHTRAVRERLAALLSAPALPADRAD